MDEIMFATAPKDERLQMLEDNCDSTEELQYFRQEIETELTERRAQVAELAIRLADIDQQKKDLLSELKQERDPVKDELAEHLDAIRLKGLKVKERVYKFVDQEAGQVGYYNAKGQLVSERRIMPSERQMSITRAINS